MEARIIIPVSVDGDVHRNSVHRNSEHRIFPYKIQIRTLRGCGLIRACRPMTLLRMEE